MKTFTFFTFLIILLCNITAIAQCSVSITNNINVSCFGGNDGTATATGTGGTAPYNYLWNNGNAIPSITGLSAGLHCVTVTDNVGCTATTCVNITQPTAVSVSISSSTNVYCNGESTGSATVTGSGGAAPYLYIWSNGLTTATSVNTGLSAGNYCVTVADANNCQASTCVNITQPPLLTVNASVTSNDASCFGAPDGVATVSASGGTGAVSYLWDANTGNQTTPFASGLSAGTYCLTATDANGCTASDCVTITQPPALSITLSVPDTICAGTTTTIIANPMGGNPAYLYWWNDGSTTTGIQNISAGTHCITITDATGCTATACKSIATSNFEVTFNPNNTLYNSLNQAFGITLSAQPYTIQTQSNAPSTLYTWTPSVGLSSTTIPNPTAVVLNSTTYYLESVDVATGCIDLDTIMIYVQQTDISSIEIAPDSSVLHCTNIPIMMSAGTSNAAASSTSNYGSTTSPSFGCFEYTSNGTAPEVVDTIVWINCDLYYSPIAFTYIPICDTNIIYITTASCVWAGDTDDDGIANNMDLLPIGLHHSATGTTRANASTDYTCQPSRNWNVGTLGNPTVDIKHIDCDGNGTINDIDTNAIILNWAQTHVKNLSTSTTGIEIYIDTLTAMPGNTISLPIVLGDALNPSLGYGIAFTVHYDVIGVDTNSVSIDFSNSWLGTIGSDMIGISKDFYSAGQVEVAMTRTDHNSVMGGGVIGHIDLTIKDDVLPKSAFLRLDFEITDVRFIDNLGDTIQTLPLPSQILIVDNWLNHSTIGKDNKISVFPNPTGSLLNIQSLNENIEMIQVLDLTGKIVLEQSSIHSLQNVLDMNLLAAGIYVLTVQTESGVEMVRVIKN